MRVRTDAARHEPVLAQECLEWLVAPEAGGLMIDGTVGDGGHAEQFLDRYPSLALLAVDVDERMLERARHNLGRFGARVQFEHGWFADVLARRHGSAQLMLLDSDWPAITSTTAAAASPSVASNRWTCG